MKNYFITFLCCFLTGCLGANKEDDGYRKFSNKITQQFIGDIFQEGKLYLVGKGASINEIQTVSLTFETISNVDVASARKLYVNMMEKYLKLLNDNLEIRPYLNRYPYGIEAFDLTIGFVKSNGRFADPPYLGEVTGYQEKIAYDIYDLEKKFLKTIYSESYDEAYKIVYGKERGETYTSP